jgi:hypothetical protein
MEWWLTLAPVHGGFFSDEVKHFGRSRPEFSATEYIFFVKYIYYIYIILYSILRGHLLEIGYLLFRPMRKKRFWSEPGMPIKYLKF